MATDEASQDVCEITRVHEEGSSQGMATNEASQYSCETTRVTPQLELKEEYRSLFEAAVKGDWKGAEDILDRDSEAITAPLLTTERGTGTVSDIAAMAGQDQFVENLVKRFRKENKNPTLRCAFYYAAWRGRMEFVPGLSNLDVNDALPIAIESTPRHKGLMWYLATHTKSIPKYNTMVILMETGHMDILLYLAEKHPNFMTSQENENILGCSAYMKSFYRSGAQLNFWERCIYQCIPPLVDTSFDNAMDTEMAQVVVESAIHRFKILPWNLTTKSGKITYLMLRVAPFISRIGELKLSHKCLLEFVNLIFKRMKQFKETPEMLNLTKEISLGAAFSGIIEIVKLCLEQYPELMWDEKFKKDLIEVVVRVRHVELFRLVTAYDTIPRLRYDFGMNCELMAAVVEWPPRYVPTDVSGSAFLMQRELQWFKVLEDMSSTLVKSLRDKVKGDETSVGKETYWDLFVEQRKDLLQEAGQWMKDTSSSCSFIATLIITVAFAAVFTVPGSNDNTGTPIFLKKTSFMVFVVADALALLTSITANLMFLAILTSRYAAKDFLRSLPRKMILGLTFLFLSLAFMLVAFGSALTIVLSERWKWIYIPITLLVTIPIILFAILQLSLYVEMAKTTFWPRLYRPVKIWK